MTGSLISAKRWLLIIAVLMLAACASEDHSYSNPRANGDDLDLVERGEHKIGTVSVVENEWKIVPTSSQFLEAERSKGDVHVRGRQVLVVGFSVANMAHENRRLIDYSSWDGWDWDVWLGFVVDRDGTILEGGTQVWEFDCATVTDLPATVAPTWATVADEEATIRKGERVDFFACWNIPAVSAPPYTLYLGLDDETRVTIDLGPPDIAAEDVADNELSDSRS